jgi:DNA-binding NarL/FixJ family response regulator
VSSLSGRDPSKVLVVDEWLCASLLAEVIEREDALDVVGIAVDLTEALDKMRATHPELVVMEIQLRNGRGSDHPVSALRDVDPDVKVVVLTRQTDPSVVQAAFDAGCAGFLTKRQGPEDVVRAIHAAISGDVPVEPALLTQLLGTELPDSVIPALTVRERSVLRLFAEGLTYADVAERLSLSVHTVRNHAQRTLVKLGAHSKLEAVVIARRIGLLND